MLTPISLNRNGAVSQAHQMNHEDSSAITTREIFQTITETFHNMNLREDNQREITSKATTMVEQAALSTSYSSSPKKTQLFFSSNSAFTLYSSESKQSSAFTEEPNAKKIKLNATYQENYTEEQVHVFYGQAAKHRPGKIVIRPPANSNMTQESWEVKQVQSLIELYQSLPGESNRESNLQAWDIALEIFKTAQGNELKAACYLLKIAAKMNLKLFTDAKEHLEEVLQYPGGEKFLVEFKHLQLTVLFYRKEWANIVEMSKNFKENDILNSSECSMVAVAHAKLEQHYQAEEWLRTILLNAQTDEQIETGFLCLKAICQERFKEFPSKLEFRERMGKNIQNPALQRKWESYL